MKLIRNLIIVKNNIYSNMELIRNLITTQKGLESVIRMNFSDDQSMIKCIIHRMTRIIYRLL